MLLRALSMLFLVASLAPAISMAAERYAALECQKDRLFVVVNFFRDYQYRLSWGIDDVLHGTILRSRATIGGSLRPLPPPRSSWTSPFRGGVRTKSRGRAFSIQRSPYPRSGKPFSV